MRYLEFRRLILFTRCENEKTRQGNLIENTSWHSPPDISKCHGTGLFQRPRV